MYCLRQLLALLTFLVEFRGTFSLCGKTVIHAGVSEQEKQLILDTHNKMRQIVALGQINGQPPASNMMTMTWNDALASRAQYWTTACTSTVHDARRHQGAFFVGQNIATRWTTRNPRSFLDAQPDWNADALSPWFIEHTKYNFDAFAGSLASHYTQLVWADTTSVGCGYAFYVDGGKRYTKRYVCNYGPSGNILGEKPYHAGYPSCYTYELADSRRYSGLCEVPGSSSYPKYGSDYFFTVKSLKEYNKNDYGNNNHVYQFFHY